jgi:beta-lactamase regulating signal transducer with metallopeptidase domain
MMDHLLQAAVRSALLAALAALCLCRVRSASIRHAVWTLVTAGMLLQMVLGPLLPGIPLRVLNSAEPVRAAVTSQFVRVTERDSAPRAEAVLSWGQVASAVYLGGLIFFIARFVVALLFARRLVRESEPAGRGTHQSRRVSAPLTIGSRILLPVSWSDWDSAKLDAVLAHEESHVHRWDWTVAAMARLNRCVFWFHPLAWWLERELARLAEQACDDAALRVVQHREQYARTLLDIARTIQFSNGRLLAVSNVSAPMAKEANVETRINRILDETLRIPKALGRRGWTALAAIAVPLMYMAAAIQLAPAQTTVPAIPQPPPPPAPQVTIAQTPAPPVPPAPPQPPPAPIRPRNDSSGTVGGPIYIPKIYNGRNKTFYFFNYDDYLKGQADLDQQAQAGLPLPQTPPPPRPASLPVPLRSDLHVAVTSIRLTMISIPLDPSGQYEVVGRITTLERKFVTSFDELADHREVVEKQIPLKPGVYRLSIAVRNMSDGKIATQDTSFEVE